MRASYPTLGAKRYVVFQWTTICWKSTLGWDRILKSLFKIGLPESMLPELLVSLVSWNFDRLRHLCTSVNTHRGLYFRAWRNPSGGDMRMLNFPTNIIPTKVGWLMLSRKSPMDMWIPPLQIIIMLESNPLKSTILVRRSWLCGQLLKVQGLNCLSDPGVLNSRMHTFYISWEYILELLWSST